MTERIPHADSLAAPPISAKRILRGINGHPQAAHMALMLLQKTVNLSYAEALTQESLAYARLQAQADHQGWLANRITAAPHPTGSVKLDRDNEVLSITLERADAHNAIDRAMRDALHEAFTLASLDPDIKRVELRGTGKAFCVGGDLAEFGTTRDPDEAHAIRMQTLPARALLGCRKKLHVHIHGACIGAGLEIAAFAVHVTASPNAWFHLPELAMGLIPGAGGCVSLPRRIGWQRTAALLLSGQRINAQTALDWGLIDGIVDEGQ
jgi:1,4-dihydroxy-2-naphthoyl-CoA synthase